jgi:hypothetical protein
MLLQVRAKIFLYLVRFLHPSHRLPYSIPTWYHLTILTFEFEN